MSAVIINGMEMPKKKNGAVLIIYPDGRCELENGEKYTAVSVPPHFDLIDHNALKIAVMNCDTETNFLKHTIDCLNHAPVVIKSDMPTYEEEEEERE